MTYIFTKFITKIKNEPQLMGLLKGGIAPFISKVSGILVVYIFYIVITRLYEAQGVGIFAIYFVTLNIFSAFSKIGLDTSIIKFISESLALRNKSRANKIFLHSLLLIIFFSVLLSVLVYTFKNHLDNIFFENLDFSPFKYVSFSIVPYTCLTFTVEAIRGRQKMISYSLLQNGTLYGFTIIIIGFHYFSGKVDQEFSLKGFFIATILSAVLSLFLYFYKNHELNLKEKSIPIMRIVRTSLPMMAANYVFFLMNWTDILMLGYYESESQTGIYNNAVKVANLIMIVLFAVNAFSAPKFAGYYAKRHFDKLKNLAKWTSGINILLAGPIFIFIILFPKLILGTFSPAFEAGYVALMILALGQYINSASGSTLEILSMTGKQNTGFKLLIITAILNFLLNWSLIPVIGITGAAIATAISYITWNLLSIYFIKKYYGFITFGLPKLK